MITFFILLSLFGMTFDCCAMETETRVAIPQFTTNYSARLLNWWQASSFSFPKSVHTPSTSPITMQKNGTLTSEFSTDGNIITLGYNSNQKHGRLERSVSFTCPSQLDKEPLLLFDGPNKQNWFVHARVDEISHSSMLYLFPAQNNDINHQSYNLEETQLRAILPTKIPKITAIALHPGETIITCCLVNEKNSKDTKKTSQLLIVEADLYRQHTYKFDLPVVLKKIIFQNIYHQSGDRMAYFIIGLCEDDYIYSISGSEGSTKVTSCTKQIDMPIIDAVYDHNSYKSILLTKDGKIVTTPNLRCSNTFEHIHTISPADAAFVKRISDCDGICNIILNTSTGKQILQCRSDYNWKHLILPVSFVCGFGLFLYLCFCGKK